MTAALLFPTPRDRVQERPVAEPAAPRPRKEERGKGKKTADKWNQ
jgi:hypothetical protein